MSGIVGVLNTDGARIDVDLLTRMTGAMAFRGPDGRTVWADHHVGLGHTLFRTSVESRNESQPCSIGDDVWISADARIDGRAVLVQRLRGCLRYEISSGWPSSSTPKPAARW
jgi:asparagine synthase (glutamine-hydrolysing)